MTVGYDATLRMPTFTHGDALRFGARSSMVPLVYTGESWGLWTTTTAFSPAIREAFTSEVAQTVRKDGHDFVCGCWSVGTFLRQSEGGHGATPS